MSYAWILGLATALSLGLVVLIRWIEKRTGVMSQPRPDRWHTEPTPHLGGVGIFLGFLAVVLLSADYGNFPWSILLTAVLSFGLGLVDDLWGISPQSKLVGLFIAAFPVIVFGNVTAFFPWRFANILISFIWLVGVANALNLLDNMDGLAGGTAIIIAGFLSYFFWKAGNETFLRMSLSLGGAVIGFWIFNFPPASIFMGDSGSLFLGLTLASLAIAREPQASNVFAVIGIPIFIFLLPILDTMMVSITRILRGQSPVTGGRDHTSHRLVSLGLSEHQTLLLMMGLSVVSGIAAVILEAWSYSLSLVLLPLMVLGIALFSAYLGRLKVVEVPDQKRDQWKVLTNWMVDLTYRRRVFEVLLDFALISFTYYLAYFIRYGLPLEEPQTTLFLQSFPILVAGCYTSFFILGIYRGVWEYLSMDDVLRFLRATLAGTALAVGFSGLIFGFEELSFRLYIIFEILLLAFMVGSRFSFKLLDRFLSPRRAGEGSRVLIYGAGDAGELAYRECQQNQALGYQPIGFVDDDPRKKGRTIHGIRVFGGLDQLGQIIRANRVEGLIITSADIFSSGAAQRALDICRQHDVWVRRLELEFVLWEPGG